MGHSYSTLSALRALPQRHGCPSSITALNAAFEQLVNPRIRSILADVDAQFAPINNGNIDAENQLEAPALDEKDWQLPPKDLQAPLAAHLSKSDRLQKVNL